MLAKVSEFVYNSCHEAIERGTYSVETVSLTTVQADWDNTLNVAVAGF